ncbi:MAG: putative Glycosyl transferase, group 1, partial [Clostridiales bacterium]|nr:putative Glycosyl transferase, group 1 [Clostridiales bacterium]
MSLTIDLRMIEHSGIGTYLKNMVPLVIQAFPNMKVNLLGNIDCISKYDWCSSPNSRMIHCQSPIYSITEQVELMTKIPSDNKLFWSPHFNIPVFYRGKLVVTIHDVFHLAMPQYIKGIHKKAYVKAMFWWVRRKADAIICDSNFTKNELMRYAGVEQQRTNKVYLGVDPIWFSIKKEQSVHNRKYLLYVGNVKPHKNLVNLLLAFSKIKDSIPEYDMIIVGKKDGFITRDTEIEKLANHLGARVIFTGYVNDDSLYQYYANAEAL